MLFVLFFFQAEDGIRDVAVTGVQTCALPISGVYLVARTYPLFVLSQGHQALVVVAYIGGITALFAATMGVVEDDRSEEHTSELQSRLHLVCRLLLEKKKKQDKYTLLRHADTH